MSRNTNLPKNDEGFIGDNGLIRGDWYTFFRDIRDWSGLGANKFDIWELDAGGTGFWDNGSATTNVGAGTIPLLAFDTGVDASIYRTFAINNGYLKSTEIYPVIKWAASTSGTGNAVFQYTYSYADASTALSAEESLALTLSPSGSQYLPAITILDKIPEGVIDNSSTLAVSISRNGTSGSDTYGGSIIIHWAGYVYKRTGHGLKEKTQ